jgi:hypothetical protein
MRKGTAQIIPRAPLLYSFHKDCAVDEAPAWIFGIKVKLSSNNYTLYPISASCTMTNTRNDSIMPVVASILLTLIWTCSSSKWIELLMVAGFYALSLASSSII